MPQPEPITDRQGLPQSFVPAIVQDRAGFIWVATRDGLCRYDGQRFRIFQPDPDGRPSLSFTGLEKLVLDHHGRIWITSERGDIDRFDPRTELFTNFSRQAYYRRAMVHKKPYQLYLDRQERLWIALEAKGLVCLDLRTQTARQFRHQADQPASLVSDSLMQVSQAPNGTVWIATRAGLERYEEATGTFMHYTHQPGVPTSLPDNPLCGLQIRPNGEVLTVSQRFVSRLNPATGQFKAYLLPHYHAKWWNSHLVMDALGDLYIHQGSFLYRFTDQQGSVALAQWSQDIDRCASLYIDRSQVLWVGTNGVGIRKYDLRAAAFQTQSYQHSFYQDLLTSPYLDIPVGKLPSPAALAGLNSYNFRYTLSQNRYLWCNIGSSQVFRIDLVGKRSATFPLPIPFFEGDNSNANPCPLATDPQNRIWAIHGTQVWWFSEPQQQWISLPRRLALPPNIRVLAFVVDDRACWLATQDAGLWRFDRQTAQLKQFSNQPHNERSLSNNAIFCLSADPRQPDWLWIGTFGSGLCLFDKRTGTCRRFTVTEGLPNNVIYSVIPDQHGQLWMGTNKGLCRMDRQTFSTHSYTHADGLLADEFNRFHWLYLPVRRVSAQRGPNVGSAASRGDGTTDDRIIMGGLEGITAFYPQQVMDDRFQPPVEFTSLFVNNQPVLPTLLDSLPIQAVNHITLAHNQNFVTAEFAALQFNRIGKNRFRYRLDGLEEHWKETNLPVATYTSLPPGSYSLVVNATNTSGVWSTHYRTLALDIRPPLWATWWARGLYGLLVIILGWGLLRTYVNRLRIRQLMGIQQRELALKQQEARQLKAVNEMKANFFANITHEFRTPLTLILAPVERLRAHFSQADDQRQLETIERNAHQVLGLVNQLLDMSKLEAGALPIVPRLGDLAQFIEQCVGLFEPLAQTRGVALQVEFNGLTQHYWFDSDKLERILTNLLSNALKFTRNGDQVTVEARRQDQGVLLRVADTGEGMAVDQLPHIFERYYQIPSDQGSELKPPPAGESDTPVGTGLGLSLVQELVYQQGGSIHVTSQRQQGTTFTLTLPYQEAILEDISPADKANTEGIRESVLLTQEGDEAADEEGLSVNGSLVLVVEDNDELAQFILESLPPGCQGIRASNGRSGLEMALSELPNMIISDVMMPSQAGPIQAGPIQAGPEMDGFMLCQELKTDLRTSHIPVMLLTAKVSLNDRLEGLSAGANEYLAKPFHVAELQARIVNQLDIQRRLRDRVLAELSRTTPASSSSAGTPALDPFLVQLYARLEENLEEPDYGGDELQRQLGMSRTGLYRKIKALTGLSPTDVIRLYRLKRAGEFLSSGLGVSQTGYQVGFKSVAHFSRVFTQHYQVPPSQFVNSSGQDVES